MKKVIIYEEKNNDLVETFSKNSSSTNAFSQRGLLYKRPFLVLSLQVAIGPYSLPKICLAVFSSSESGCILNASNIFLLSFINIEPP